MDSSNNRVFTLRLVCVVEKPISDDEIIEALKPYYLGTNFVSGPALKGFIGLYGNGGAFMPICYRNLRGNWYLAPRLTMVPDDTHNCRCEHFIGVNPSQADIFMKALNGRVARMLQEFQVSVVV